MRLLEGMKNAKSASETTNSDDLRLNEALKVEQANKSKCTSQPTHNNIHTNNVSDDTNAENGIASSAYNRDQSKRTNLNGSSGGHENGATLNQEHVNGAKPANGTAPVQRTLAIHTSALAPPNSKQILPHCGSSLPTPCAKALYDFDSKESR